MDGCTIDNLNNKARKPVNPLRNPVRTYQQYHASCYFARLQDEVSFDLEGFFSADVSNLALIIVTQRVKAQAVAAGINELLQIMLAQCESAPTAWDNRQSAAGRRSAKARGAYHIPSITSQARPGSSSS